MSTSRRTPAGAPQGERGGIVTAVAGVTASTEATDGARGAPCYNLQHDACMQRGGDPDDRRLLRQIQQAGQRPERGRQRPGEHGDRARGDARTRDRAQRAGRSRRGRGRCIAHADPGRPGRQGHARRRRPRGRLARSHGRSVRRLLSVRVRRLDPEQPDPAGSRAVEPARRGRRAQQGRDQVAARRRGAKRTDADRRPRSSATSTPSCMDEAAIERAGTAAFTPLLARTQGVKDDASWLAAVIELHKLGISVVWDHHVARRSQGARRPPSTYLDAGGLGLPDRDYYLKPELKRQARRLRAPRRQAARAGRAAACRQAEREPRRPTWSRSRPSSPG